MRFLILGGTGSLGKELTKCLLKQPHTEITCLSRDELKQQEMKAEFGRPASLSFALGDIRDPSTLARYMQGVHTVFHVAALKHVDVLEANPEESIKTNIIGTMNVANVAEACGVHHVVFSSTDKAVDPINVYGMCKGISERLLLNRNRIQSSTKYAVYRWGNVVGSRGSAIHAFAKSLKETRGVSLTHPEMTRFWIRIEDAVRFMMDSYLIASRTEAMIPEIKAASVCDVIQAIAFVLEVGCYELKTVGIRPGEKIHESLRSFHEKDFINSKHANTLSQDELRQLISPLLKQYIPALPVGA